MTSSVTVTRTLDAPPEAVEAAMRDVEPFVRACGFDEVTIEDDLVHIENRVGILTITLTVRMVERDGRVLAYEAVEGPFSEMTTEYELDAVGDGTTEVTARTTFALAVALVGEVMDGTVVKRQRRRELEAQFDWLAEQVE